MKMLGLDIGGVWVGVALSDGAGITCRPYKTVRIEELLSSLQDLLEKEEIGTIVVGHPITVGGGKSQQTIEIEKMFTRLKSELRDTKVRWVLWDERYTSQRATEVMLRGTKRKKRKDDKERKEHSIAAAFILQSYIDAIASGETV